MKQWVKNFYISPEFVVRRGSDQGISLSGRSLQKLYKGSTMADSVGNCGVITDNSLKKVFGSML